MTPQEIMDSFQPVMTDGAMRQLWRTLEAAGCTVSRDNPDEYNTALWHITVVPPAHALAAWAGGPRAEQAIVVLYEQHSGSRIWQRAKR